MVESGQMVRSHNFELSRLSEIDRAELAEKIRRMLEAYFYPANLYWLKWQFQYTNHPDLAMLAAVSCLVFAASTTKSIYDSRNLDEIKGLDLLTDLRNFEVDPETIESRPGGRKWHQTS